MAPPLLLGRRRIIDKGCKYVKGRLTKLKRRYVALFNASVLVDFRGTVAWQMWCRTFKQHKSPVRILDLTSIRVNCRLEGPVERHILHPLYH